MPPVEWRLSRLSSNNIAAANSCMMHVGLGSTSSTRWVCRQFPSTLIKSMHPTFSAASTRRVGPREGSFSQAVCRYPALVDDDFVIYESFAMTQYLATKYGADTPLSPATVEEAALVQQWSLWCITETEAPILSLLSNGQMGAPADQAEAAEKLVRPLTALEDTLSGGTDYLVGNRFTVADLNVCSVIGSWGVRGAKLDLSPYPNVDAWATKCMARPACKPPKTEKPKL